MKKKQEQIYKIADTKDVIKAIEKCTEKQPKNKKKVVIVLDFNNNKEDNKVIDFLEYKKLKEEIKKFNENFFDEFNEFIEFNDAEISELLNSKEPKKNL